jgi:histidine ammonia-lyase
MASQRRRAALSAVPREGKLEPAEDLATPLAEVRELSLESGPPAPPAPSAPSAPSAPPGSSLPALREQFWAVVANIPGAVYRCACDANWTIRFMSEHIATICGYPAADFIDNAVRRYGSIIHPEDRPYVIEEIDQALEAGSPYTLQYRVIHADGSTRWVCERGRAILGEHGEHHWLDGVILDVTDQVLAEQDRDRAEAELRRQAELNRHQALHDALTGLPNRVLFHDRVSHAIRAAERDGAQFAVLVLDLDRFKEVNDTLGHAAGDQLLLEVGARLQTALRGEDSIARLGGDEFAILLVGAAAEPALEVASRVREALDQPLTLHGLPLRIDASVGIALYPTHAVEVDGLIQRADVAMYVAKHNNVGSAIYDSEQDAHQPERLSLVTELRGAIQEGALVLYYQPKIEVRDGRVRGVEALVRWRHPERGLLGPDEFIDAAQETSLIGPFTRYVIDEALRQCQEWARAGHELMVSVNVSSRNLIDTQFPGDLARLLDKWGVPPSLLELEVTESAVIADPFRMKAVLERLGAMGLRLSVDDFGTGYTSLGYLTRLPINELKIDRSFVSNMTQSEQDEVIVRSTIDLGRNLGLDVVAEGVESAEVLERLRSFGCDVAQGFLMSRPVSAGELTSWLNELPARDRSPYWQVESSSAGAGPVLIGEPALSIADVARVAVDRVEVGIDRAVGPRMTASRGTIDGALERGERVYGLNTGVGPQKRRTVAAEDQGEFNRLMILAHCVGHGDRAPESFVRAAMLVRAQGLALGAAGVRPAVVGALVDALNAGVHPTVHVIGSIGQSDLSPMAEIARALIGAGPDGHLMGDAGLRPLDLAPREALALISSNAFSVGVASLSLAAAGVALHSLELAAMLSFEGFLANVSALDRAVARLRPHDGMAETIDHLRGLLDRGALLLGTRAPRNLQDPLCFRNLPQVHASARHALSHAIGLVETELRSGTDNPAVIADEQRLLPNGNHDITPIAVGLDYARLALAQAITISNERIQKFLDPRFSGLPSGLRAHDDLPEDGLGVIGHGATALSAECRLLAAPVTLEQPSSAMAEGIEDRVTLAPVGARRLYDIAQHALRLAAVELVCAAQAVDLRGRSGELGSGTADTYRNIRQRIAFTGAGESPTDELEPLVDWLRH